MFLLVSCATEQKIFVPEIATVEKGSIVYIYRPNAFSNIAVSPDVLINGVKNFPVSNNRYTLVYLKPGLYEFKLDLDEFYQGNKKIELNVGPEETYYLKIETALKFEPGKAYNRRFDIKSVQDTVAVNEIAHCRYSKPVMPSKYLFGNNHSEGDVTHKPAPEFSIDKTSDPFSRKK